MPGSTRHSSGPTVAQAAAACIAAVAALGLSACGGGSSGSTRAAPSSASPSASMSEMSMPPSTGAGSGSSSAPSMADMIMIQGFKFSIPASVPAGSTVEVMNMDSEAHTVTADSGGEFDVNVPPGKTVTITAPSQPGSYPFHCKFHSNMHAVLRVS